MFGFKLSGIGGGVLLTLAVTTTLFVVRSLSGTETFLTAQAVTGKTITTSVGATFNITAESNPSTGYRWAASFHNAVLRQEQDRYIQPVNPQPGAFGSQVFTFRALKAGTTQVTLRYSRPWESVQPFQTRTYTVTVRDPAATTIQRDFTQPFAQPSNTQIQGSEICQTGQKSCVSGTMTECINGRWVSTGCGFSGKCTTCNGQAFCTSNGVCPPSGGSSCTRMAKVSCDQRNATKYRGCRWTWTASPPSYDGFGGDCCSSDCPSTSSVGTSARSQSAGQSSRSIGIQSSGGGGSQNSARVSSARDYSDRCTWCRGICIAQYKNGARASINEFGGCVCAANNAAPPYNFTDCGWVSGGGQSSAGGGGQSSRSSGIQGSAGDGGGGGGGGDEPDYPRTPYYPESPCDYNRFRTGVVCEITSTSHGKQYCVSIDLFPSPGARRFLEIWSPCVNWTGDLNAWIEEIKNKWGVPRSSAGAESSESWTRSSYQNQSSVGGGGGKTSKGGQSSIGGGVSSQGANPNSSSGYMSSTVSSRDLSQCIIMAKYQCTNGYGSWSWIPMAGSFNTNMGYCCPPTNRLSSAGNVSSRGTEPGTDPVSSGGGGSNNRGLGERCDDWGSKCLSQYICHSKVRVCVAREDEPFVCTTHDDCKKFAHVSRTECKVTAWGYTTCQFKPLPPPVCGNRIVEAGEECDYSAGPCGDNSMCKDCVCFRFEDPEPPENPYPPNDPGGPGDWDLPPRVLFAGPTQVVEGMDFSVSVMVETFGSGIASFMLTFSNPDRIQVIKLPSGCISYGNRDISCMLDTNGYTMTFKALGEGSLSIMAQGSNIYETHSFVVKRGDLVNPQPNCSQCASYLCPTGKLCHVSQMGAACMYPGNYAGWTPCPPTQSSSSSRKSSSVSKPSSKTSSVAPPTDNFLVSLLGPESVLYGQDFPVTVRVRNNGNVIAESSAVLELMQTFSVVSMPTGCIKFGGSAYCTFVLAPGAERSFAFVLRSPVAFVPCVNRTVQLAGGAGKFIRSISLALRCPAVASSSSANSFLCQAGCEALDKDSCYFRHPGWMWLPPAFVTQESFSWLARLTRFLGSLIPFMEDNESDEFAQLPPYNNHPGCCCPASSSRSSAPAKISMPFQQCQKGLCNSQWMNNQCLRNDIVCMPGFRPIQSGTCGNNACAGTCNTCEPVLQSSAQKSSTPQTSSIGQQQYDCSKCSSMQNQCPWGESCYVSPAGIAECFAANDEYVWTGNEQWKLCQGSNRQSSSPVQGFDLSASIIGSDTSPYGTNVAYVIRAQTNERSYHTATVIIPVNPTVSWMNLVRTNPPCDISRGSARCTVEFMPSRMSQDITLIFIARRPSPCAGKRESLTANIVSSSKLDQHPANNASVKYIDFVCQ